MTDKHSPGPACYCRYSWTPDHLLVVTLVVEDRDLELVPLPTIEASIESRRIASW